MLTGAFGLAALLSHMMQSLSSGLLPLTEEMPPGAESRDPPVFCRNTHLYSSGLLPFSQYMPPALAPKLSKIMQLMKVGLVPLQLMPPEPWKGWSLDLNVRFSKIVVRTSPESHVKIVVLIWGAKMRVVGRPMALTEPTSRMALPRVLSSSA